MSAIDVQAFLNEHPFSRYQWLVFALCFFIVLLDGFDTAAIGYIAPSLVAEWGVERPALARLATRAAVAPAPTPLSTLTTERPGEQLWSIPRIAAAPRRIGSA